MKSIVFSLVVMGVLLTIPGGRIIAVDSIVPGTLFTKSVLAEQQLIGAGWKSAIVTPSLQQDCASIQEVRCWNSFEHANFNISYPTTWEAMMSGEGFVLWPLNTIDVNRTEQSQQVSIQWVHNYERTIQQFYSVNTFDRDYWHQAQNTSRVWAGEGTVFIFYHVPVAHTADTFEDVAVIPYGGSFIEFRFANSTDLVSLFIGQLKVKRESAHVCVPLGGPQGVDTEEKYRQREQEIKKYIVQPGDTLQSISNQHYGTPHRWMDIFSTNDATVSLNMDPYVPAGQTLCLVNVSDSTRGMYTPMGDYIALTGQGRQYPNSIYLSKLDSVDQQRLQEWYARRDQKNVRHISYYTVDSTNKHFAVRIIGQQGFFIVQDDFSGQMWEFVDQLIYSPLGDHLSYRARGPDQGPWYVVTDQQVVSGPWDYIATVAYTVDGKLHTLVKQMKSTEESWLILEDNKIVRQWAYADNMIYGPRATTIVYRAKEIQNGKEYWRVVVDDTLFTRWNYVDSIRVNYQYDILTYRARDDQGKWHYRTINLSTMKEIIPVVDPFVL